MLAWDSKADGLCRTLDPRGHVGADFLVAEEDEVEVVRGRLSALRQFLALLVRQALPELLRIHAEKFTT